MKWVLILYLAAAPEPQAMKVADAKACDAALQRIRHTHVVSRSLCLPAADLQAIAARLR